ncbi:cytochrome c [Methylobacterium sp. C25]|uniref:c-type cytochrome n=1 Tax=Methylobacterium sp. C25 TaxID=2721622 RepID=UPI001F16E9CB|nr:cytochrome c [Methylobacterium sp. C25]MCE4225464.1 cytochrome c [Methylobacterium sp. C25]
MRVTTIGAGFAFGTLMFAGGALADAGPFSQKQAEDGKTKFNNHCAQCHRPNLAGGTGPALTGDEFKKKWAGKPVAELRTFVQEKMPQTAPGSLGDDQIDPIVAFVLSKNGVQPGDKDLTKGSASAQFPK